MTLWEEIRNDRAISFLILVAVGTAIIFTFAFIFSIRPLDWHMRAMQRILLVPGFLAWMAVAFIDKGRNT